MNTSVTLISVITMYLGLPETQTTGLKLEREREMSVITQRSNVRRAFARVEPYAYIKGLAYIVLTVYSTSHMCG